VAEVRSGLVSDAGLIVPEWTAGLAGEEFGAAADSVLSFVTAVDTAAGDADWLHATASTSGPMRIPKCPLVNNCSSGSFLLCLRSFRFQFMSVS